MNLEEDLDFDFGELWANCAETRRERATSFHGVLLHVSDDREIWRCAHDHLASKDAVLCAKRKLGLLRGEVMG